MREQPRPWSDVRYVVLLVADGVRWCAWWLLRALSGWGALLCGDPRLSLEWTAVQPRPRSLRHEMLLRREVERGIAHLEAYLSAAAPAGGSTRSSGRERHRRRPRRGGSA